MRKPVLFVITVGICAIAALCAVSLAMRGPSVPAQPPAVISKPAAEPLESPSVSPPETVPENKYMLRSEGGVIVVCRPETPDKPEQVTEIAVASLRLYDQRQLELGITVEGEENLLRLLEDFVP